MTTIKRVVDRMVRTGNNFCRGPMIMMNEVLVDQFMKKDWI